MRKTIITLLLATVSMPAASAITGNEWLAFESGDDIEKLYALGYFQGVMETQFAVGMLGLCIDKPENATHGQAQKIVIKWMNENPSETHTAAITIFFSALSDAWGVRRTDERGFC